MTSRRRLAGPILLALALAACSRDDAPAPADPILARRLPEGVRAGAAQVAAGNNEFAFDLYHKLSEGSENLFFSPFSISTAFALTFAGARGTTEREMAQVLHFPLPQEGLHPVFRELLASLNTGAGLKAYRLDVANRLWGQVGYGFLPEYLALTREQYQAELATLDFARAPEAARARINAWVSERTQKKIGELLPAGTVTDLTRLVLTNAIYFKGKWQRPFDPARTREAPFHVNATRSVAVPMMMQHAQLAAGEAAGLQVVELPYAGRDLSMLILLPETIEALPTLERSLTPANLESWRKSLAATEVDLYLPRFTVTSAFALKATLAEMGMPEAFSENADFSGMNGRRDLLLQDARHKAYVNVNEEGTEAAAATGVTVGVTSVPPSIRVDHPFVFMIWDNVTASILFLGRVVDPSATQ